MENLREILARDGYTPAQLDYIEALHTQCAEVAEQIAYCLVSSHGITLNNEAKQHVGNTVSLFVPELISLVLRHRGIPSA
jgi:hypothetical protein